MFLIFFSALTDEQRHLVEQIFKDNHIKFYRISFKILKSESSANDAVSSAFLKIMDNIERISDLPCPQMMAFCVTIVKNASVDIIRQSERLIYVDTFEDQQCEQANSPEEEYISIAEVQEMKELLSRLSQEERQFIHLRYANEMGYEAIGKLLGLSTEAARKRGQRIVQKLKKLYEERGNGIE